MHYVGANLGYNWAKIGDTVFDFDTPNERVLSFHVPDVCAMGQIPRKLSYRKDDRASNESGVVDDGVIVGDLSG